MSGNSAGDTPGNGGAVHFLGATDSTDDTFTWADGSLVDNTAADVQRYELRPEAASKTQRV